MAEETLIQDDIDLETLQAQIDLSLAHTKDLVASWIKPSRPSSSKSRTESEKEIEDLLRQPARLGVGAPLLTTTGTLGIETARLKSRLAGKKRAREDDGATNTKDTSEDDDESRGSVIKKRTKPKPLHSSKGKKKNTFASPVRKPTTEGESEPGPSSLLVMSKNIPHTHSTPPSSAEVVQLLGEASATEGSSSGTPKKKKKKKHSSVNKDVVSTFIVNRNIVENGPTPGTTKGAGLQSTPPPSPHSPSGSGRISSVTNGSTFPVLNLEGPPSSIGNQSPTSPKKRRKRRRKKKGDVADGTTTQEG